MKVSSRGKALFVMAVTALLFVSISIILMPFASMQKENGFMTPIYIVGGSFWLCLVIGYSSFFILNNNRKKQYRTSGEKAEDTRRIGFLRIWSNLPAKVFDILTAVSFLALIIVFIIDSLETQLIFSLIAAFFFSMNMHCLFNGANYIFIKSGIGSAKSK